ncbi:hypothetical protein Mapa_011870 [Marchantia paleacea]|nr:hypothetical protein Mapa_011870 [Marchantia paleacea]
MNSTLRITVATPPLPSSAVQNTVRNCQSSVLNKKTRNREFDVKIVSWNSKLCRKSNHIRKGNVLYSTKSSISEIRFSPS